MHRDCDDPRASCVRDTDAALTYLDDLLLFLEDSSRKRTLATVVQSIGVRPMLDQELDQLGMAVVRREHEL